MKIYELQLTTDLIRKSLQGLEIELVVDEVTFKIHPPVRGILFTPEEVKKIQYELRLPTGARNKTVLDEILKYKFDIKI